MRDEIDPVIVACLALMVIVVAIGCYDIRTSKDIICTTDHKAYTVSMGKTWRTENKDSWCPK